MKKRKKRIITKAGVRYFLTCVVIFLLGMIVSQLLSLRFELIQLHKSNAVMADHLASIERYLGQAFGPGGVEPQSIRKMSLKIQKLPWVTEQEANLYSLHICFEADKNKVDPRLIYWLIYEESSFKIGAVSYKNCQSLTQLNPKVFPQYTIKELRDPRVNIPEGIRHFADCKRRAKGNQEFAVRLYHGDPYDPASIRHGRRVMQKYRGEVI